MTLADKVKKVRVNKTKAKTLDKRSALLEQEPPSICDIVDESIRLQQQHPRFFRPSMLGGCDRQNVFHYAQAPWEPQPQDLRMQKILDNGTGVHEVVQDFYFAKHPDYWFCKEPKVYREVGGTLIRGSCDGVFIRRRDGYRFGVEIKTIAHDSFMRLATPLEKHVFQASIYMVLQDLRWIVVYYWDKDKQNHRDYPVRFNPAHWRKTVKRVQSLRRMADRFIESPDMKHLPRYVPSSCQTGFCNYVGYCRKMGAPV